MNSKRRAELQRKLSMGAVPRPPADLSDRIKADIPQYLQTDVERARFSGSVAFSMRVAASILLLITTAFVTLRLLESEPEQVASFRARPQLVPAITQRSVAADTSTAAAQSQPLGQEVRLEIAEEIPVPSATPAAPAAAQAQAGADRDNREDERQDDRGRTEGFEGWTAMQETTIVADAAEDRAEPKQIADEPAFLAPAPSAEVTQPAPPVAVATPLERETSAETARKTRLGRRTAQAPAAAMAPPPSVSAAPPALADAITVTGNAPSLVSEAHASTFSFRQKPEVFGISIDPTVFLDMKSALQDGKQPAAASVNVDALVNYFAGSPEKAPRRITLDVEASPAPVEADGDHAILRFTIDTPRITVGPRESTPPAATEAHIDIEIDPKAVASFHRIGGSAPGASESMLLHNLSVTGLYRLELHPQLTAKQHVATVRLRYRSVSDGKPHVLTRVVRGSDLARDWARASRRHRLASLGAIWSESLKGNGTRIDVARRAKELSTQKPEDARARELANAASATAGGARN
jgi:hypothetical protein